MKVFRSDEFSTLTLRLEGLRASCDKCKREQLPGPTEEQIDLALKWLDEAKEFCKAVGFKNGGAKASLSRTDIFYGRDEVDFSSLSSELRNVKDMMMVDFAREVFVEIGSDFCGYVNNEAIFGLEVSTAFKSALPDIREAGNCMAVDCGTASVFHLMRAVECGLHALCRHLGVTRIRRSNKPKDKKYVSLPWSQWEPMLNSAEKKANDRIEKLRPGKRKQELQEFYIPIFQDLRGFKDAFRNHVMHSRRNYNQQDAQALLGHVKRFMSLLATKVHE